MQPSMIIGELNRRITLQNRSPTVDSVGQQSTVWTDALTTWANITQLAGRELLAAQAVNAETTHELTLRWRTGISSAQRAVYQGRIFNVLGVIDRDTGRRWLTLLCSEGLTLG